MLKSYTAFVSNLLTRCLKLEGVTCSQVSRCKRIHTMRQMARLFARSPDTRPHSPWSALYGIQGVHGEYESGRLSRKSSQAPFHPGDRKRARRTGRSGYWKSTSRASSLDPTPPAVLRHHPSGARTFAKSSDRPVNSRRVVMSLGVRDFECRCRAEDDLERIVAGWHTDIVQSCPHATVRLHRINARAWHVRRTSGGFAGGCPPPSP